MDSPEKLQKLVLHRIQNNPQLLQEVIDKELGKQGLNILLQDDAKKIVHEIILEAAPPLVNNISNKDCYNILKALSDTKEFLPNHIKDGHLKALKKELTPEKRIKKNRTSAMGYD